GWLAGRACATARRESMTTPNVQLPTPRAIAFALFGMLVAGCGGAGRIAGSVNEVEAGPLANVQITIDGLRTHEQLKTDSNGRFELSHLATGAYTLKAESSEYVSDTKHVTVPQSGNTTTDYVLHPPCLEDSSYVDGDLAWFQQ